jgi:hypothetical protein
MSKALNIIMTLTALALLHWLNAAPAAESRRRGHAAFWNARHAPR